VAQVWRIVAKDLVVEWRSREIVYTMSLFSVLMVVIFTFAFTREGQQLPDVAGGLLWVVIAFSGTIGLGRVFDRERDSETISALLLTPAARGALYLGKLVGVVIFMLMVELIAVPLLIVLLGLPVPHLGYLIVLLLLGTLGYAAVGSLFAATLMRTRSKQVLLGILTYPIVMPVLVAGAKGTAALLATPAELEALAIWLKLLGAFDLLFVVVSMWSFGPLVAND
jgi:heme exporter protein CcmB